MILSLWIAVSESNFGQVWKDFSTKGLAIRCFHDGHYDRLLESWQATTQ